MGAALVSTDLVSAHVAYDTALEQVASAKDVLAATRDEAESRFADLLDAAAASDDEQISKLAEAIRYTEDEIANKIDDPDAGVKALKLKVREAAGALREAARTGDARAAEASLATAEEDLIEVMTDVRLLKKAYREHVKQLDKLLKGIV